MPTSDDILDKLSGEFSPTAQQQTSANIEASNYYALNPDQQTRVNVLERDGLNRDAAIGSVVGSSAASTSSQAKKELEKTGEEIDKAEAEFSIYGSSSGETDANLSTDVPEGLPDDEKRRWEMERDINARYYDNLVNDIQGEANRNLQLVQEAQKQQTGAATAQLARMGALNVTTAGIQYLNDLNVRHGREVSEITRLANSAITKARIAQSAADLKLLGEEMDALNDYRQAIQDSKNAYFDNLKKMAEIKKLEGENFQTTIDNLAASGLTDQDIPDGYLNALGKAMGLPEGAVGGILNVAREEYDLSRAERYLDMDIKSFDQLIKMQEVLEKLPEGESIMIDGVEYFGRKTPDTDYWQSIQVDEDGYGTLVMYDKKKGIDSLSSVSLGHIGAAKDGWINAYDSEGNLHRHNTRTGETRSVQTRGGYVNPATESGFSEWASRHGQISVNFGESTNFEEFHPGIDIGNTEGTLIEAFFPKGEEELVVTAVVSNATNDSLGYGNYVEVQDSTGRTWRYSHLRENDPSTRSVGDVLKKGDIIGAMGHTGSTYSVTGGDGSHLDLRVMVDGEKLKGEAPSSSDTSPSLALLTPNERLQAKSLSTKLFGVRAGTKAENVETVAAMMASGMTRDEIEDEVRFGGESPSLTPIYRTAITSALKSTASDAVRQSNLDAMDDLLSRGDEEGAKDYLVETVIDNVGVDAANNLTGQITTLKHVREMESLLDEWTYRNGDTNILIGTQQKIENAVGKTGDPELARIWNRMKAVIQNHRRAMSGAAFSAQESQEYRSIFPNIGNEMELNRAKTDGLRDTFELDVRSKMELKLGRNAYKELGMDYHLFDRGFPIILQGPDGQRIRYEEGLPDEALAEALADGWIIKKSYEL